MVRSFRSAKTVVRKSPTQGRGLFARRPIRKGEIVSIKGGRLLGKRLLKHYRHQVGNADLQIADGLFLAPITKREHDRVMMYLNHSCEPNVGIQGQIVFVSMRDIRSGEELTIDYAMFDSDSTRMRCNCQTRSCRGVITDRDWQRPDLQRKYGSYFSWYLLEKIRARRRRAP